MHQVRLTKISELPGSVNPQGICTGMVVEGTTKRLPQPGESFIVNHATGCFITSLVEKTESPDCFQTLNSVYRLERLSKTVISEEEL